MGDFTQIDYLDARLDDVKEDLNLRLDYMKEDIRSQTVAIREMEAILQELQAESQRRSVYTKITMWIGSAVVAIVAAVLGGIYGR